MISLRGKRALVTGGSRGIGGATAVLLAECGADVGIGYRSRGEAAVEIVKTIAALGVRGFAQAGDHSTRDGVDALIERMVRELGGIDILIGNAGIWPSQDVAVADMDDERWHRTIVENLDAIFYLTRAAVRIIGTGGRVVLISSTAGQRGEAYHADYAASKGAVIAYVKSLAIELAGRDITVNCVAPGWVDTEMAAPALGEGRRAQIEDTIPVRRLATARDIAGPTVFLCSEHARHITGEILNVNGGAVLCG